MNHPEAMTRLSAVLTPLDLPLAELSAARLDGELFSVDDAYSPIDLPDGPTERARSVAPYCQGRLMAEQNTAAWIWGARTSPPRYHELCASLGARARPAFPLRTLVREVVIDTSEFVVIAGIPVTTPLRTIVDLVRFGDEFDDEAARVVSSLLVIGRLSIEDCRVELERRHNLPNKKRARVRLASLGSSSPILAERLRRAPLL
jgi:hypothetical protein